MGAIGVGVRPVGKLPSILVHGHPKSHGTELPESVIVTGPDIGAPSRAAGVATSVSNLSLWTVWVVG